jgi:hypothetical protein
VRSEAPTLHLLKAERLPATVEAVRSSLTPSALAALSHVCLTTEHHAELLARVENALAALGPPGPAVAYNPEDHAALTDERYEEHDQFFCVQRVDGNPVEAFIRALLEACRAHLLDSLSVPSGLVAEHRHQLVHAFTASWSLLEECGPDRADRVRATCTPVQVDPVDGDPLLRWKLGHQVFFALVQSLVVTVGCAVDALRRGDQAVHRMLDVATVVMRGSGAALRYAGDFSPLQYRGVVRPAMMPPNLAAKFSGLQIRDHAYLLKWLAEFRPILAAADEAVSGRYQRFVAEMGTTYDAHRYVCARFGGDAEPSLRMSAASSMTAADVLERLKQSRSRSVTPR